MPRKRTTALVTTGVAAALAAGVALWRLPHAAAEPAAAPPGGTARVTKRDLVVTEQVTGDLGYADERDLTAHRTGVLTWLAAEGTTVRLGGVLFAVDLQPTVLLTGRVPAFRPLSTASSDGPDVKQLETALKALGHGDGLTVDEHFSAATADAVEQWEEDLGRTDPDGRIELGDVVFAPGSLRITAGKGTAGSQVQPMTPVLAVASTTKVADIDLDVDKADLVAPKDTVDVELPDGRTTPGTVVSVGTHITTTTDAGAGPTIAVVVRLTRPADAKRFDSGSVTVDIEQSRDKGVLAVPVTALVALTGSGYALQVVDRSAPGGYRLTPVEVGTVTDDYAAVTGAGVREGLTVVVPA